MYSNLGKEADLSVHERAPNIPNTPGEAGGKHNPCAQYSLRLIRPFWEVSYRNSTNWSSKTYSKYISEIGIGWEYSNVHDLLTIPKPQSSIHNIHNPRTHNANHPSPTPPNISRGMIYGEEFKGLDWVRGLYGLEVLLDFGSPNQHENRAPYEEYTYSRSLNEAGLSHLRPTC